MVFCFYDKKSKDVILCWICNHNFCNVFFFSQCGLLLSFFFFFFSFFKFPLISVEPLIILWLANLDFSGCGCMSQALLTRCNIQISRANMLVLLQFIQFPTRKKSKDFAFKRQKNIYFFFLVKRRG